MLEKCLAVFGIGILELWAAVPAGMAMNLNPVLTGMFSALGSLFSVIIVLVLGEPFRVWILKFRKNNVENPEGRVQKIWNKYGIAGLGLLSSLLVGAHIGAAFAVASGAAPKKIIFWFSIGIAFWATVVVFLAVAGMSLF